MNKNTQKIVIRVICIILALLMAGSVLLSVVSSMASAAPSKEALNKLKNEQKEIKQRMQNIKSQINSLEYEQAVATAKKEILDEQVQITQDSIDNLTVQIEEYGNLIIEKEQEVIEAQAKEDAQWELYKVRMRAMEENGSISYYAIIFGANDFSDMLFRIDAIESIMEHDEKLYNDLVRARHATEDAKVSLENAKIELENTKTELSDQKVVLEQQVAEAGELIAQIEKDKKAAEELYDAVSEEEDKIKDEIAEMEEALKKQTVNVVGTGQFIWPSKSSSYITSKFGVRSSPTRGASTNHKGVDVGRIEYGSNVLAADSGTVLTATYSSSYGYYVTVSHGNGYTTLYAHMSKLNVSAGQTVKQGDTVGFAGSTGISTATHLHFEIWDNGTRVNPLKYFDSSTYTISPNA